MAARPTALLSGDCPVAVWQGADDESQIGAYHLLFETQGVGNLRTRIDEYLPFGLEAGIFLVPSRAETPRAEPPGAYGPRPGSRGGNGQCRRVAMARDRRGADMSRAGGRMR